VVECGLSGLSVALHQAACLLCMCDPRDLGRHAEPRGAATPPVAGAPAGPLRPPPPDEPVEQVAGWRPTRGVTSAAPAAGWPTVYLYDSVPGGVGFAEHLFAEHGALLAAAAGLVDGCGCRSGCPSCVGPPATSVDVRRSTRRLLEVAVGSLAGGGCASAEAVASGPAASGSARSGYVPPGAVPPGAPPPGPAAPRRPPPSP
jgi:MrfA Zn-binding domain